MRAATSGARTYLHTLARRDEITWAVESFLSTVDVWICPVASLPGFPHRPPRQAARPLDVDGEPVAGTVAAMGHTLLARLTGHPVVVLPLPHPDGTLPLGVQVVGRLWQDSELLAAAQALTGVTGGYQPPPGFA